MEYLSPDLSPVQLKSGNQVLKSYRVKTVDERAKQKRGEDREGRGRKEEMAGAKEDAQRNPLPGNL